jgi:pSer/pThr/pTyr-binding forkhead associated (FHA) protein
MTNTYRLILVSGNGAGTEYPLEKTELQLGRDLSNDIVINDPEVSRRHARLILQPEGYVLEDLGSTNGTFIRGQRLAAPVVLKPGESITIGEKVNLKYEVLSSDQSATVVVQRRGAEEIPAQVILPPAPQPVPMPPPAVVPAVPSPVMVPPPGGGMFQPPNGPGFGQYPPKKKSKVLVILLILLAIFIVFCVIPLVIIDLTKSWCAPFIGDILNILFGAGTC